MSQQNQIEQTKNVLYYSWMSLAITLCPLIPIPFIDFFLEPFLAKKMFSKTNLKKGGVLNKEDLEYQENRRKRKVRKLNFEIRWST